jgi:transposase
MPEFRVGNSPDKFSEPLPSAEFLYGALLNLKDRFDALDLRLSKSEAEKTALMAENAELRSRLKMDSHNSSKPPSSDGPGSSPRPKSLRSKSRKKSGGKKGHPGQTLEKSPNPDKQQDHFPEGCCCGQVLGRRKWFVDSTRQDVDLPIIKPLTTEHRFWAWICPKCGETHRCAIPAFLSKSIQYGPRVTAFVIYLNIGQHLPYDRIQEMLAAVTNLRLSQGTIRNRIQRVSAGLKQFIEDLQKKLAASPVAHFDETGMMVDAINHWIHSASTETEVCYFPHPKRGKEAMDAGGILSRFHGVGIHDFWGPYFRYDFAHGLCCTHLLRELIYQKEEMKHRWAGRLIRLLKWMHRKRLTGESPGSPALQRARKRWDQFITGALSHTPRAYRRRGTRGRLFKGKARSLLERLRDHADECLRFAFKHGVPFSNNLSERDIRMAKLKQKVSGGFRSFAGAVDFCRIRSYVATMLKRGIGALEALIAAALGAPIPVFAE